MLSGVVVGDVVVLCHDVDVCVVGEVVAGVVVEVDGVVVVMSM